jgi:hypothetical protein
MTRKFAAEYDGIEALVAAAGQLCRDGHLLLDAFTPFPVARLDDLLEVKRSKIRLVMLIAGLAMGAFAYGLQWYSSVVNYPLDVGGRPLNSWPVFMLVPFEVGILAAVIAGLIAFLANCGLPALHHPIFDIIGFERASQDRFFLLVAASVADEQGNTLRHALEQAGAISVSEMWSA